MSPPLPDQPKHGGDLAFARALYGEPAEGWLDLSTGINPGPYPAPALDPTDLARLPDRERLAQLIETARAAFRISDGVPLIAVPGSELAIRLLPTIAPPGDVMVIGPTYGSHAEAWRIAGREVREADRLESIPDEAALVVLANPNNPDGRTVLASELADCARQVAERGGSLIVDEAFADLAPEASLAPYLGDLSAVVLRSFGKFYGLPGLRLGFVAGIGAVVDRLASLVGEWPVSGPAITIGQAALSDLTWREQTRARLRQDSATLRSILTRHDMNIAGGTSLFVLAAHPNAGQIHEGLARQRIWTRAFDYRPEWLRFGLPPDRTAFERLDRVLGAVMATATTAR